MKTMQYSQTGWALWLVAFALCSPATAAKTATSGSNSFDGSTSIRVLLDEGSQFQVGSVDSYLYLSLGKRWYRSQKPVSVECPKANAIRVNGKLFSAPLRLRGGLKLEHRVQLGENPTKYPGEILIHSDDKGCLVVNHLPLHLYLAGTLAGEIPPTWPMETLKAQAVASRTYALKKRAQTRYPHYDVVGTVLDQVYSGSQPHSSIAQAVRETDGTVLYYRDKLAQVFFHSRCGGKTAVESAVWKTHGTTHVSVPCPYCQEQPHHWQAKVPLKFFSLPSPTTTLSLTRSPQSPGQRWHDLHIHRGNKIEKMSGDSLRRKIGYSTLRSTLFETWKIEKENLVVSGRGNGHGVGMCQWGAQHLGQKGMSYQGILKHYYPRLTLHQLSLHSPKNKPLDFSSPQG